MVVFAEGQGNYAISGNEKQYVLAKIQDGMDRITAYEPGSNVITTYSLTTAQLPQVNLWDGAHFERLPMSYYKGFDAALWNKLNSKLYLFSNDEFVRMDTSNGMVMETGYPSSIASLSNTIPRRFANGIDAAMWNHQNDRVLFFKDDELIRLNPNNNWQMDSGYPKQISDEIPGLPGGFNNGIDAAVWEKTGKILLFNKEKMVRIDPSNNWQIDSGFPALIDGNIRGINNAYKQGIDAAFMHDLDDRIYIFKNQPKVGNFFRIDATQNWSADTNDPLNTGLGWKFEGVWRDAAQLQLGYGSGKKQAFALSDHIQSAVGAQFGFIIFVTKFPTAWHGYVNGRKMILRKAGADRGPVSFENWKGLHKTVAHEIGHIFGAVDEYGSNACSKAQGRFIRTTNGNSKTCSPPTVPCIMKNSSKNEICDFSRKAVGWWAFVDGIDASFYHPHDQQHYLFSKDYFIRYSANRRMRTDYAQHVSDLWPTINMDLSSGFDASFWNTNDNKLYFFKGDQMIRISTTNGWNPDPGFPVEIVANLRVPTNFQRNLDAAMWNGIDSTVMLFKGNECLQIDPTTGAVVPGYPQSIDQFFQDLPTHFTNGIDSALWSEVNNCIFLFRKGQYVKVDPNNNWTTEDGYPKWINGHWDIAFPKVR